jgi:hypothetical protein
MTYDIRNEHRELNIYLYLVIRIQDKIIRTLIYSATMWERPTIWKQKLIKISFIKKLWAEWINEMLFIHKTVHTTLKINATTTTNCVD